MRRHGGRPPHEKSGTDLLPLRLVHRLTYNSDVAAGQLAVFQGASDEHI
jgi:hypothetical protein